MNKVFLLIIIPALTLTCIVRAESPGLLLSEDFSLETKGPLAGVLEAHPLLEIIANEGVNGTHGLKATYQGCDRGSERIVIRYRLLERVQEATLCYDVRFEEDFQFVRGGKLNGLGPDRPISGGNEMTSEGWSARVNFSSDESLRTYLYIQNKDGIYGASRSGNEFTFERGRYYAVSLHMKLNSNTDSIDGFAKIYVDGELLVDHTEVQFRASTVPESEISNLLFSSFHGGSSPVWAPRDDEGNYATVHAMFDNFAVYEGRSIRSKPGTCWK